MYAGEAQVGGDGFFREAAACRGLLIEIGEVLVPVPKNLSSCMIGSEKIPHTIRTTSVGIAHAVEFSASVDHEMLS